MSADLAWAGVAGQAAAVRAGETSARALAEHLLARIETYDGSLGAFTNVLADEALAEASARDEATARGDGTGPLHGVPIAIKEEVDVGGAVTTFGGRANHTPAAKDGPVVARLRDAGAVIIGKTNMPEFGQWPFTESVHGKTRNPWDLNHTPGGSSGGTAVAVAAGLVAAGIGGDGGGSIRIPAACCGLFGLKPSRGRVTAAPMSHLWWALGTTGPLTRSVLDSAIVYDVIRGNVPGDRFTAPEPSMSFTEAAGTEPRKLRVGWSTKPVTRGIQPAREHVRAVLDMAGVLAGLGHQVEEVDPGYPDPTLAFLPQFFGGVRAEAAIVEDPRLLERRTRQVVALGSWARPAVIERAIRAGESVAAKANRVFQRCDVLLTPTIAHRPNPIGVLDKAGPVRATTRSAPMIAYTALWNVTGHPAASVPAGFAEDGMPLAVQLVGRFNDEPTLLSLAAQIESARPWADRTPSLPPS